MDESHMEEELEDAANAMEQEEVRVNARISSGKQGKDAHLRKRVERSISPEMDDIELEGDEDETYAEYDKWESSEKAADGEDNESELSGKHSSQRDVDDDVPRDRMPIPMLID